MDPTADLLSDYARYHRDRRNILSHFVGVPLIVFALGILLARPSFNLGGLALGPAWIAFVPAAAWFLTRGNLVLGLSASLATGMLVFLGQQVAQLGTSAWLAWGFTALTLGWLVQFAGHWYEGRRPAFTNDIISLLVGPMFVTAEALFAIGWNRPLQAQIEQRVGPTLLRDLAKIA